MVDKDIVRRGYEALADVYASERSDGGEEARLLERFIAGLETPARVLDAGCGHGAYVTRRLHRSEQVLGLDIAWNQLILARENLHSASLVQADIANIPAKDDTFDGIVAMHSLIHLPDSQHQSAIAEFARVLRPGGRLLVSEGSSAWSGSNPTWLDSETEMQWNMLGPDVTRGQLCEEQFSIIGEFGVAGSLDDNEERWCFFLAELTS